MNLALIDSAFRFGTDSERTASSDSIFSRRPYYSVTLALIHITWIYQRLRLWVLICLAVSLGLVLGSVIGRSRGAGRVHGAKEFETLSDDGKSVLQVI